jgi:hypothetical protein
VSRYGLDVTAASTPGVPEDPDDSIRKPAQPGPLTAGSDQTVAGAATGGGPAPAPDASEDRPRPTNLSPDQLGFTPRQPVPWLNPVLLAGTAVRVVLAELFGAYLDKRELQSGLSAIRYDEDGADELWLDYVADLGDGFDSTYTIAYLLAQKALKPDGAPPLPRASVLVMGGDEVYPTASGQQYEDRFKGPYRAALPEPPAGEKPPTLYALPGNHDWYDGLTAFLRLFARVETTSIGAWTTKQQRSYFAVKLPHRWWLLAIDVQFGAYLDEPQLAYFREIATQMEPGDRIIICPPSPDWVDTVRSKTAYDTIDYFVRKILVPHGVDVKLMISGDLHHYARYSSADRQLITCGGGGAYLYPTHRLPEDLRVPPDVAAVRRRTASVDYERARIYPTEGQSRRFAAEIFGRMPVRNPAFVAVLGTLHMFLMLAYANALQRVGSGVTRSLVTIPLGVMILVVLGSTVAFAMPTTGEQRRLKHWMLGSAHGLAHIGLGFVGARIWLLLPLFDETFPLPLLAAIVTYLPPVALVASAVVGLYLLIASMFDVNVNELFAAQGIVDTKSFLRMHFAPDGSLTIYAIGVDRVSRRWRANPAAPPHAPWIEPVDPVRYKLVDDPVRLA